MGREELGRKTGRLLIADLLPGLAEKGLVDAGEECWGEKNSVSRLFFFFFK